ncbi:LysR family transcriptional regulator [Shewanella psychrotolerans]|uniref:LysR family transcriptional regulator n=1 Tax=Shewanella psychrotolerans TaxID=2864206 RepID=UPI001C6591AF|nr:LysR family transcriptional regulator [Shewanella psychrotolerans]QYK00787.1 LysR family transcriptional regulator [Shewanella psychrotolerans]
MDSFEGIVEFIAVAESNGFSAAARQLGSSTSHVSRQISRLETRLGCALFARTTRSVNLTQAGQSYYQQCKNLLVGLKQANEEVSQQQLKLNGTLRVSAAGAFAEQYIAPVLIKFASEHPELTIDMDFNSRMVNFVEDGIDFAIRFGTLKDSGLVARKLANRDMMAVASPEYLAEHSAPKMPNDLKRHSCIISNNDHWLFHHPETDAELNIKVEGRWRSNNVPAVIAAAEQGLGIAYLPKSSFVTSLEKGSLTPVLAPYWTSGLTSWIVYQNRRFLPMRARMAIDYLIAHFKDWQE